RLVLRRLGASGICAPRRRGPHVVQAVRTVARCAASSGASLVFKVHHARRAGRVARRAGAKVI
ncbi:hypothetical protein A2U01_0119011, partial [Trifolium medium]|nr:hypothetical protein [Trifolium medium]